jgi:hypothetical protein
MPRRWTDAPTADRCGANITLKDGSGAQCGRRRKEGKLLCWQHYQQTIQLLANPRAGFTETK